MPFVSFPERYGFQRGRQEGLLEGIAALLEVKFGQDGLALLPAIRQQTDIGLLDRILQSLRTASSVEEVRGLLPSGPAENGQTEVGGTEKSE